MRAVFLPSDLDGSGHYRSLLPMRELRLQHGWECFHAPFVIASADGRNRPVVNYGVWEATGNPGEMRQRMTVMDWLLRADFDVLVMQQRAEPFWADIIRQLQAQGKRVLVDSDDKWMNLPSWNPGSTKKLDEVQAMLRQIRAADGLSVATPHLASVYGDYQPNTRVIRNRLDWRMWADATPAYEVPRRRVRVGWMGEVKWRKGDLHVLRGVLGPWLEARPGVEFVAAGDPRVHDVLNIPRDRRVTTNRVNFWEGDLADITATFDIGLIPLDMTNAKARGLNEGKSHLKGLEYNAAGIPFIATPSESYLWWARESGGGLLASKPKHWRDALDGLLDAHEDLGRAGRKAAERHTLQKGGVDEWRDWITGVREPDTGKRAADMHRNERLRNRVPVDAVAA